MPLTLFNDKFMLKNNFNLLESLIDIAICPKCESKLELNRDSLSCKLCGENFIINDDGIIIFNPRLKELKNNDKYEDEKFVCKYAGVYAFGYKVLFRGQMESLHRTASELILSSGINKTISHILDVGCGVGRATYDSAKNFQNSFVIGVDLSEEMLRMAKRIITERKKVPLDLSHIGFGVKSIEGFGLKNVLFLQSDADHLPFSKSVFDIVININLIDRVESPDIILKKLSILLKPNGNLIFTSPLNWTNTNYWKKFSNIESIIKLFENNSLIIEELFDGLIYREAHDARGSYSDWNTLVIKAKKLA